MHILPPFLLLLPASEKVPPHEGLRLVKFVLAGHACISRAEVQGVCRGFFENAGGYQKKDVQEILQTK